MSGFDNGVISYLSNVYKKSLAWFVRYIYSGSCFLIRIWCLYVGVLMATGELSAVFLEV